MQRRAFIKMIFMLAVSFCCSAGALSSVRSIPGAFTASECRAIASVFERTEVEIDVREEKGIRRRNYWLRDRAPLAWALSKISTLLEDDLELEFALMHEFLGGDFFDWHVDTKPNDGTSRTINVNVILSTDFQGGHLQLGDRNATLGLGDLHAYPASLPHKVHDISSGRRRTLVLAVKDKTKSRRGEYWARSQRDYEELCETLGAPKLHWIYGEFLEALGGGRDDLALQKYADAYRATPERNDYVDAFKKSAADHHASGRLSEARDDLKMCLAVDPSDLEAAVDLAVVFWSLDDLVPAETVLRNALEQRGSDDSKPSQRAAICAALSFVLDDLPGRRDDAVRQRQAAIDLDPDVANDAFIALDQLRQQRHDEKGIN